MSSNRTLSKILTARDKIAAHREIRLVDDRYEAMELSVLGLTWNDLDEAITSLQVLVVLIGHVVRGAGFAWDHFDEMVAEMASHFWKVGE